MLFLYAAVFYLYALLHYMIIISIYEIQKIYIHMYDIYMMIS